MKQDPLDRAWPEIRDSFGFKGSETFPRGTGKQISKETIDILVQEGIADKTCSLVQAHFNFILREDIVPRFWNYFSPDSVQDPDRLHKAVSTLHSDVIHLAESVTRLEVLSHSLGTPCRSFGQSSYPDLFKLMLKGTLHSQLPKNFEVVVRSFYDRAFHVYYVRKEKSMQDSDEYEEEIECSGCKNEVESCICNIVIKTFHQTNHMLIELDLLERLASHILTEIVHLRIKKHVEDTCQGSFTCSFVDPLKNWLDDVVMAWIREVYTTSADQQSSLPDESTQQVLERFRKRLRTYLYETYTRNRIHQLFNIIVEFPDSLPALNDLSECLAETDLRSHLTTTLTNEVKTRLLHLGVNTSDILTAYIASIRVLRVLDPSGISLEVVCDPIRRYLRTRDDTVRCIVQSLIDDSNTELADELKLSDGLFLDESFYEEEDMADWASWVPDPTDINPNRHKSRSKRTSDIISMLVNIYGSKELFVNEYRSLLSNRLLSKQKFDNFDTDSEIRNLELLKLRFGEAPLHQCEVMLKDIGDSKRINGLLHTPSGQDDENSENTRDDLRNLPFPVNAIMLSAQFWPQLKEETLKLPEQVTRSFEIFTKAFETLKGNRTLVWKNHLGHANIDVEVGGKKINLTVSPVQAAIIFQFEVKAEWTAEELAKSLKIPTTALRRRIAFWQSHGIIREVSCDRFALIKEGPMRRMSGAGHHSEAHWSSMVEDDEAESVTRTSRDQREEDHQLFWSYTKNMLINMESLPLEKIFQMLKMFIMHGGPSALSVSSAFDMDEVRQFLDKKVRDHELVFSGGQYKLPSRQ